jgi:predicted nucleic acid-binding protein
LIVYAETNFLLEVAYLQERSDSCTAILDLARHGSVSLVIPAFSVAEARNTWDFKLSERNVLLRDQLQPLIRQLSRSRQFQTLPETSKDLLAAIVSSGSEARDRLEEAITILHQHGTIQHLTGPVLSAATELEHRFSLSPPDSLVLSSVVEHLKITPDGPKCFASQDKKGFANPAIYDELAQYDCKVLVNFGDALAHIESSLRRAG